LNSFFYDRYKRNAMKDTIRSIIKATQQMDELIDKGHDNCELLNELIESPKKAKNFVIKIPLKNSEVFVSAPLFLTTYIKGGVWQYLLPHMIIERKRKEYLIND